CHGGHVFVTPCGAGGIRIPLHDDSSTSMVTDASHAVAGTATAVSRPTQWTNGPRGTRQMNEHEETIVRAFIASARRARWLESLASSKRRPRMLDRLNHCRDLDERYTTMLPSNADVVPLLRLRGAPPTCYVLSCTNEIDGQVMKLEEAVSAAELGGW